MDRINRKVLIVLIERWSRCTVHQYFFELNMAAQQLRVELYGGVLKVFEQVPAATELCKHFQDVYLQKYSPLNKPGATHANTKSSVRVDACEEFEKDLVVQNLWKKIIHFKFI